MELSTRICNLLIVEIIVPEMGGICWVKTKVLCVTSFDINYDVDSDFLIRNLVNSKCLIIPYKKFYLAIILAFLIWSTNPNIL